MITIAEATKGDYLVLAEVGIPNFQDLACSKCLPDPLDTLAMPNIDFINLQAHTWNNSPGAQGPCKTAMIAANRFKKPVIIDTDSAFERNDKCRIEEWASEISSCGTRAGAFQSLRWNDLWLSFSKRMWV